LIWRAKNKDEIGGAGGTMAEHITSGENTFLQVYTDSIYVTPDN
jgi:hypothetical protein